MSDPYVGEVRIFAGQYAPVGWHLCDGTVMQITGNETLYSLIGTVYGGDGRTTFALPDLRGRAPVSQGRGNGLSNVALGQSSGFEQVTLTYSNLPSHTHLFVASTAVADQTAPTTAANTPIRTFGTFTQNKAVNGLYNTGSKASALVQLNQACVGQAGGSGAAATPVDNMMSSMPMNYIIALQGIYPSQA